MDSSPAARLSRAQASLQGLSAGDAFGEGFFMSFELAARLMEGQQFGPPPYDFEDGFILREFIGFRRTDFIELPWRWTDDTALALEIVAHLEEFNDVDPDELAAAFSRRYLANPRRGYGGAMHALLPELRFGDWDSLAPALFGGTGSFGNGAAMRSAPIGAYFADTPELVARAAAASSVITHAHAEGIAGSVAVAMAACFAARGRESGEEIDLISEILPFVPVGAVRNGILRAQTLAEVEVERAARELGTGEEVSAQDTVPFCLWCAARNLDNYEEALWETVAGLGDRDTTCAIVGGIVAARTGVEGIPSEWLKNREPLDQN